MELFPTTAYPDGDGTTRTPVTNRIDIIGPGNNRKPVLLGGTMRGMRLTVAVTGRESSDIIPVHRFFQRHFYEGVPFYFTEPTNDLVWNVLAGIGDGSNRVFNAPITGIRTNLFSPIVTVAGVAATQFTRAQSASEPYMNVITFNVGYAPNNGAKVRLEACGSPIYKVVFESEAEPIESPTTGIWSIKYNMAVVA